MREVRDPDMVQMDWRCREEEIREHARLCLCFTELFDSPTIRFDAEQSHDAAHPLFVYCKCERDPPVAVCGMLSQNVLDALFEIPIFYWQLWCVVRCRTRDAERGEER